MAWKCSKCGAMSKPNPPGVIGFQLLTGCAQCENMIKNQWLEEIFNKGKFSDDYEINEAMTILYNKVKACVPKERVPDKYDEMDKCSDTGFNNCREATLTNIDKLFGRE